MRVTARCCLLFVAVDTDIYFEIYDPLPSGGSYYGVDRDTIDVTVNGTDAIVGGEFQAGFRAACR